jgi:hypothetical protein
MTARHFKKSISRSAAVSTKELFPKLRLQETATLFGLTILYASHPICLAIFSIFDTERRLLESCAVLRDQANKRANICLGIHESSGAQTLFVLSGHSNLHGCSYDSDWLLAAPRSAQHRRRRRFQE